MDKKQHFFLLSWLLSLLSFISVPALSLDAMAGLPGSDTLAAERLNGFSEGLSGICRESRWGYINSEGKLVIKCIYDGAGRFSNRLAPVRVDSRWGYVNRRGRLVINPLFDEARPFGDGIAAVRQANLWGMTDTKGRMVIDFSFDELGAFQQGLAPAQRLGKWGYIDRKGEFVIKRIWTDAGGFSEGLAPVKGSEGHWGYIDRKGVLVLDCQFDEAGEFGDGLAAVRIGSRWGYVNWQGKFRINPQFDQAGRFSERRAAVKINGKWGYIDPSGTEVIRAVFAEAGGFSDGLATVTEGVFTYCIDAWGVKQLRFLLPGEAVNSTVFPLSYSSGNPAIPSASYAANSSLGLGAEVNPQTGQLEISMKCISLPGITPDMDLNLGISRQDIAEGDIRSIYGFPPGWKWDLDYIDTKAQPRILHQGGSSSLTLDEQWQPSGLRFIKAGRIRMEVLPRSQLLPYETGNRLYLYRFTDIDGSSKYFDHYGRLLMFDDRFGNHISYFYDPSDYPENTRLVKITDSYEQDINIDYRGGSTVNSIFITMPDERIASCRFEINPSDQSNVTLSGPEGKHARILFTENNKVRKIIYPSGGCVSFKYTDNQIKYQVAGGQSDYFPAVTRVISDPCTPGCELMTTDYEYGSDGKYYTGAPYYDFGGNSLMMSGDNSFRYTTRVIYKRGKQNGNDVESEITYNHLSLTAETEIYQDGELKQTIKPVYQGQDASGHFPGWNGLDRNYNRTIQTISSVSGRTFNEETVAYNDHGQVSSSVLNNGDLCLKTVSTFYDTRYGLLKSSFQEDNAEKSIRTSENILSADDKYIAGSVEFENGEQLITTIQRDEHGRLISERRERNSGTEPSCTVKRYGFTLEKSKMSTEVTDSQGNKSREITDIRNGFLCEQIGAMQERIKYDYKKNGLMITKTYQDKSWESVDMSDSSKTVRTTSSGIVETEYLDGFGRVIRRTDNRGEKGQERRIYSCTYNELGEISTETDQFSHVRKYFYNDWQGRKTDSIDHLGNSWRKEYDPANLTESLYYNNIPVSRTRFDEGGNKTRTIQFMEGRPGSDLHPLTEYRYNAKGQAVSTRLMLAPDLGAVSSGILVRNSDYDLEGNEVASEMYSADGSSSSTHTYFNIFNYVNSSILDCKAASPGIRMNFNNRKVECRKYDAVGNVTAVSGPMGDSVVFTYDRSKRKVSMKDRNGIFTRYVYDSMGRVVNEECGRLKRFIHYYAAGTPFCEGLIQSKTLYEAGMLKDSITFGYNRHAYLSSVTYLNGKTRTAAYDEYGRLIRIKDVEGTVTSIIYDSIVPENIVRMENKYGRISYDYYGPDDGPLFGGGTILKEIVLDKGIRINYEYYTDPGRKGKNHSLKIKRIMASGSKVNLLQLGMALATTSPLTMLNSSQDVTLLSSEFSYDDRGRLTMIRRTSDAGDFKVNLVKKYSYNDLDQMISERTDDLKEDLISLINYEYDVSGNIVSRVTKDKRDFTTESTVFTYDDENKLIRINGKNRSETTFQYNPNGSMVSVTVGGKRLKTFDYNEMEQLVHYTDFKGNDVIYGYNAEGLRSFKKDGRTGYTISYYYDRDKRIVNEEDSKGIKASTFSDLLRVIDGKSVLLIRDVRDVIAVAQKKSGRNLETYNYSAYGSFQDFDSADDSSGTLKPSASSFSIENNPFLYSGYYFDEESGMYYLKSRFYDPGIMRFLTTDSYDLPNKYAYGGGNPVMMTDPGGHLSQVVDYILKGVGIVGGIATAALSGGTSVVGVMAIISASALTVSTGAQIASNHVANDDAREAWRKVSFWSDMAGMAGDAASLGVAAGKNIYRASPRMLNKAQDYGDLNSLHGRAFLTSTSSGTTGKNVGAHLGIDFFNGTVDMQGRPVVTRYHLTHTMDADDPNTVSSVVLKGKNWRGYHIDLSNASATINNVGKYQHRIVGEIDFRNLVDVHQKTNALEQSFNTVVNRWVRQNAVYSNFETNCRLFASDMLDEVQKIVAP